ncbi:MAG: hypothetical protein IT287_08530 [Bdellovibrionaceae bacterium]|nr:hypothetical protein [Pseudobdellovibrionaceae bacterium]
MSKKTIIRASRNGSTFKKKVSSFKKNDSENQKIAKSSKSKEKLTEKLTVTRRRNKKEDVVVPTANTAFCGYEWLQLAPKGVIFEGHHFVLILEDKEKKVQLPLRFPLQSADMISVPNMMSIWKKSLATVHEKLFPMLDLKLQRCVFIPGKGEQHRVKVFFIKDGAEKFLESDLDRILGLCLEAKLPFYATRSYIQQAKVNGEENEIFLQNQRWTDGRQKYLM